MTNELSLGDRLKSPSSTVRATAAMELKMSPEAIAITDLVTAIQSETVPQIRRTLNDVLKLREENRVPGVPIGRREVRDAPGASADPADALVRGSQQSIFQDLGRVVKHELEPAIGRIRSVANQEIPDFKSSKTNVAIQKLQRRVDGVIAVVKQRQDLVIQSLSLSELLNDSWPEADIGFRPAQNQPDVRIDTDEMLFGLVLANAFQNGLDASAGVDGGKVTTTFGESPDRFWVRISNPFSGHGFVEEDIQAKGNSSKSHHLGEGVALMRKASRLLGLSFRIEGQSGTATFVLTGSKKFE